MLVAIVELEREERRVALSVVACRSFFLLRKMRLSLSPFAVRRSARLAGRPAADLTGHPVVLDGEDAPGLDAHALEEEDGVLFAAGANAAREEPEPQPAPSARELAAAEAARARLYGGGEAAAGPSGAEVSFEASAWSTLSLALSPTPPGSNLLSIHPSFPSCPAPFRPPWTSPSSPRPTFYPWMVTTPPPRLLPP